MCNKINIRPIELRDLEFVKEVLNEVITNHDFYLSEYPKSDGDIRQWYDEHQNSDLYAIFIAEVDGTAAGWVSLSNFRSIDGYDISAELSVYVSDCYYRMGVASAMMKYIEWEDQVCIQIEDALEISRSDAQAIMEANDTLLSAQWAAKSDPLDAAHTILAI